MEDDARVMQIVAARAQAPLMLESHTALLVIDMQRNFVDAECAFGRALEKLVPGVSEGYFSRVRSSVLPNVRKLLDGFRARGLPVLFTATGTQVCDGGDLAGWLRDLDSLGNAVLGSRVWPYAGATAWQIADEVAPLPGELLVNKTAADPLGCTSIDQTLRNLGITGTVVCGLTTDVCVTSTGRGCADRGYRTVIAADACTTLSPRLHQAALDTFQLAFGAVRSTDDILQALPQSARASAQTR